MATDWHLRLLPTAPHLVDLVMDLPVLDASRAERELGWAPTKTPSQAIDEFLDALRDANGSSSVPVATNLRARLGHMLGH